MGDKKSDPSAGGYIVHGCGKVIARCVAEGLYQKAEGQAYELRPISDDELQRRLLPLTAPGGQKQPPRIFRVRHKPSGEFLAGAGRRGDSGNGKIYDSLSKASRAVNCSLTSTYAGTNLGTSEDYEIVEYEVREVAKHPVRRKPPVKNDTCGQGVTRR